MMFFIIAVTFISLLILIKIYAKLTIGRCTSTASLDGKTALVTGSSQGIGYWTAMDFATRNARVILACRSKEKGEMALESISKETGNTNLSLKIVDMSDFASIRRLAKELNREEKRLDILVNNAGMAAPGRRIMTKDGNELVMQTNYFGPFLLTHLLLDLLKKSAPSRIITVSSVAHKMGRLNIDDLNNERGSFLRTQLVYSDSKLANVLFSHQLSKKLEGEGVTSNSLEPGSVNTSFFSNMPFYLKIFLVPIAATFFRTAEEGAQTTIHCAVAEELEGVTGKYFSECQVQQEAAQAQDDGLASKLWEVTEGIVGLT